MTSSLEWFTISLVDSGFCVELWILVPQPAHLFVCSQELLVCCRCRLGKALVQRPLTLPSWHLHNTTTPSKPTSNQHEDRYFRLPCCVGCCLRPFRQAGYLDSTERRQGVYVHVCFCSLVHCGSGGGPNNDNVVCLSLWMIKEKERDKDSLDSFTFSSFRLATSKTENSKPDHDDFTMTLPIHTHTHLRPTWNRSLRSSTPSLASMILWIWPRSRSTEEPATLPPSSSVTPRSSTAVLPWLPLLDTASSPTSTSPGP